MRASLRTRSFAPLTPRDRTAWGPKHAPLRMTTHNSDVTCEDGILD
jgi:hypothetical protein